MCHVSCSICRIKTKLFFLREQFLQDRCYFCENPMHYDSLSVYVCISNRMFPLCYKEVSKVFLECFRRGFRVFSVFFSHKNIIKKLATMSKNLAFSQKVLEDLLRLPERQDLFAGLGGVRSYSVFVGVGEHFQLELYLQI